MNPVASASSVSLDSAELTRLHAASPGAFRQYVMDRAAAMDLDGLAAATHVPNGMTGDRSCVVALGRKSLESKLFSPSLPLVLAHVAADENSSLPLPERVAFVGRAVHGFRQAGSDDALDEFVHGIISFAKRRDVELVEAAVTGCDHAWVAAAAMKHRAPFELRAGWEKISWIGAAVLHGKAGGLELMLGWARDRRHGMPDIGDLMSSIAKGRIAEGGSDLGRIASVFGSAAVATVALEFARPSPEELARHVRERLRRAASEILENKQSLRLLRGNEKILRALVEAGAGAALADQRLDRFGLREILRDALHAMSPSVLETIPRACWRDAMGTASPIFQLLIGWDKRHVIDGGDVADLAPEIRVEVAETLERDMRICIKAAVRAGYDINAYSADDDVAFSRKHVSHSGRQGDDVLVRGETALIMACRRNDLQLARLLVDHGADWQLRDRNQALPQSLLKKAERAEFKGFCAALAARRAAERAVSGTTAVATVP